jgi:hypothetical protein
VARYAFFCINKRQESKPFIPRLNNTTKKLETSIYLIDTLTDDEIWDIGQTYVVNLAQAGENKSAAVQNRKAQIFMLRGRFDFDSDCLSQNNMPLRIETDNIPYNGHSNLLDWNEDLNFTSVNEDTATRLKEKCATYIPHA